MRFISAELSLQRLGGCHVLAQVFGWVGIVLVPVASGLPEAAAQDPRCQWPARGGRARPPLSVACPRRPRKTPIASGLPEAAAQDNEPYPRLCVTPRILVAKA